MGFIKTLILRSFSFLGYELRKNPFARDRWNGQPEFHSDLDPYEHHRYSPEAHEAIRVVRNHTMLPYVNLVTLFEQVRYCETVPVPGDYVECGVWKGGACALMALANLRFSNERRVIRLFDIFDDICEPDPEKDGKAAIEEIRQMVGSEVELTGRLQPVKGVYKALGGPGSIAENRYLLEDVIKYDPAYLRYHKGWFQEEIPNAKGNIEQIAILRLDGDLYHSIKTCLDGLYDLVVSGGFIIIDDYGNYQGCTQAVDEFRKERGIESYLHFSNATCRYWMKD
jgi:O-methyltransferase